MTMNNKNLFKIVERISLQYSVKSHYHIAICFMVDCLGLIKTDASDADRLGMQVARDFCLGIANNKDIKEARIACWKHIDQNGGSQNISDPKTCTTRAILCALYEEPPSEEISEIIEWFLQMLLSVEKAHEEIYKRIIKYFPKTEINS
ncbi:hypothetical protein M5C99_06055 [Acidovorax sp. NCPPB 2350]|nr:hypothetical protein M5C99_06055 [Acidovorax sp. NCPPB 2350]